MTIRKALALTAAVALTLAATACSDEATPSNEGSGISMDKSACSSLEGEYPDLKDRELVVGISPAPANYSAPDPKNPSGIIGIEPDLLTAAGDCLGFTFKYSKLDFSGLVPALQAGRIDLIAAGMYSSEERVKQVDFVEYMKAGEAALVAADNPKGLNALSDICGVTAALVVGTVESEIITKQSKECEDGGKPAVKTLSFPSNDRAQSAVAQGDADIFLTDAGVAAYLAKKMPDKLAVGFDLPTDFRFGFGVNKKDTELRDGLHAALVKLYDAGAVQDAMKHWGFNDSQELKPSIATA